MKKILPLLILVFLAISSFSATFTVTNTNDSGAGSLRAAITSANAVGADIVAFNIPTSDLGYNSSTGVWTITLLSELPYFTTGMTTLDGTTQTTNQGNTNIYGPEIFINGSNTVAQCFILPTPSNVVKGIIIGNFTYGINIYGTYGTGNTVSDCYIGISGNGASVIPNDVGITVSDGAASNDICRNLITGNNTAGVYITAGSGNEIFSNKIGTDYLGTDSIGNGSGIILDNTTGNTIGGTTYIKRNIISGNSDNGILINASPNGNNIIQGNFIGCDITGKEKCSNSFGIILANSGYNDIGGDNAIKRNIISGNIESGILINGTGGEYNEITGNYIGVDSTGIAILDNHVGILIKTNADKNIIGGNTAGKRNVISGNSEIGVYIESCDSNTVIGNYIGPDATGTGSLSTSGTLFQANGIELNTVAMYNVIGGYDASERNIISGNRVYGMIYYGQTSENYLIGNYIGTDVTGNVAMPNATGICVDASSNHNYIFKNILSGNISYGIFLVTTGTYFNEVVDNFIGLNSAGTAAIPNDIGLLLGGGAQNNIIMANVISGNNYNGIEAADNTTNYNQITQNYIGTDFMGEYAIPNGNGIGFSSNPKHNVISGNIISGNNGAGIILYEYSDSNIITSNVIGSDITGNTDLGNKRAGIVVATGSSHNMIGGIDEGNIIAYNDTAGVLILDEDCLYNTISANSIFQNGVLGGIDLFPFGHNPNDAGDVDMGANELMNCPVLFDPCTLGGTTEIGGYIDCQFPESTIIEIFISDPDPSGYGQGKIYLGSTGIYDYDYGYWVIDIFEDWSTFFVTATATDINGNTSEFALNKYVDICGNISNLNESNYTVYPNPAQNEIFIETSNFSSRFKYDLFDATGRKVKVSDELTGNTTIKINTSDLSPGMYSLRISGDDGVIVYKLIVE
ncbi:MAG: hypothetical protein A2W91_01930 [Bacteroidetes bacterium GWF2_38_335]|nr:MAG: hypothetical protein A2W91_01930 [Bacteroidetes bacterium GWF2_38_335]OFY80612.1 MAG: hypothetical protein A2281_04945 [Bacteroidetes bacterium RIFOXYA12_FULL_38_20]HBS86952.1 hypothetical protein [Bacteroidales bacterium]